MFFVTYFVRVGSICKSSEYIVWLFVLKYIQPSNLLKGDKHFRKLIIALTPVTLSGKVLGKPRESKLGGFMVGGRGGAKSKFGG